MDPDQNISKRVTRGRRRALWVLLIGVSVTALIIGAIFRFTTRYAEMNGSVRHTFEVKAAVRNTLVLLDDAETGERGYLLSGESQYLEPKPLSARSAHN